MKSPQKRVREAYQVLLEAFGPQRWWPADSPFEMAVGAVLTQNTAWRNAERAVARLKADGLLSPAGIRNAAPRRLEGLIKPAGFPKRKARSLRGLAAALQTEGGLEKFLRLDQERMRSGLLAVWGIGPETADAIVLYAAGRPTFVVDEYTRRFAERHGLAPRRAGYEEIRKLFASALDPEPALLGEYHALLVRLGKEFCRTAPRCWNCPLRRDLPNGESTPDVH